MNDTICPTLHAADGRCAPVIDADVGQIRIESMKTATGKYLRQRTGLVAYASVTVRVELESPEPAVIVSINEGEFSGAGFDDWRAGAAEGARFGLVVLGATARVEIIEIQGTIVDTYPSALAAAAALAVWKSLNHEPSQAEIDMLDDNVRMYFRIQPSPVPQFQLPQNR